MSKYAKIWDAKNDLVSESDKNTPWFKIMHWMPEGKRVLDVGCSSGYFGEKLIANRQAKVWGIELDPSDAAAARKRGYQAVFEGDLDSFDWSVFKSLSFDAIIFADVLEHIKDPVSCLKAAKKLLSQQGSIYCSIPNIANMTIRLELMEGNFDYEQTGLLDNTHIRFFTKKTVYQTFADAGLNIVKLDATTNEYSNGQVKARLAKLGLQPSAEFDKVLASNETRTFQFILEAKVATDKPKLPPEYSISAKLHDEWPAIAQKMEADDKLLKAVQAENIQLHEQLSDAKATLDTIHRHPVRWTAKKVVRKVARRDKR